MRTTTAPSRSVFRIQIKKLGHQKHGAKDDKTVSKGFDSVGRKAKIYNDLLLWIKNHVKDWGLQIALQEDLNFSFQHPRWVAYNLPYL